VERGIGMQSLPQNDIDLQRLAVIHFPGFGSRSLKKIRETFGDIGCAWSASTKKLSYIGLSEKKQASFQLWKKTFDLQKATCIPPYLKGFPLNLTGVADMSVAHKYAGNGHLNHVSIIPGRIGSRGNMNVGIGHVIYLHNLFEERDIQLPPLDKSKIIVGSLRTDRDIALSSYLGFIPTIGKTAYNSIVTEYATDNGNKSVFESINLNQVIQTYSGMVNSHRSFLRSPTQLLSEKTEMANITNEFILEMEKFVNDSGWFGEFQHLLSYDNSLFFSTLV